MPRSVSKRFKLAVPDADTAARAASTQGVAATQGAAATQGGLSVTAKVDKPDRAEQTTAALILAHGANNNLDHSLLAYVAAHLAAADGVAVLRFNFPYVERGAESPDSAPVLEATFRAAYDHLVAELGSPQIRVFVGGKSLGGRVAAELVSRRPEGDGLLAAGLIELGYPLHAPGRTDRVNVKPLRHVDIPSLFCVGSRDPFCDLELLRPVLPTLTLPGELYVIEGGDHSLVLPRTSGRGPEDAYPDIAAKVAAFISTITAEGPATFWSV